MQVLDEAVKLGPFRVHFASSRVFRDGLQVELRRRAFRALKVLVENPGRLVSYEQMIRDAWDGIQVSKHTVAVTIAEIKHALGEYGFWIHCQPKFGYRLEVPQSEILIRRGWHYWNQYNRKGYENALHCFHQAEAEDSADFRALDGIASTYLMLASFLMRAPCDLAALFWDAHNRTVAAWGDTWERRLDAAYARFVFDHDLAAAERELMELQRQRLNSAHVYIRLAMLYSAIGRLDEAFELLPPALAADALLPPLAFIGSLLRLFRREFDAAAVWAEAHLDLHPSSYIGRVHLAEALEFAGRVDDARTQYETAAAQTDVPLIRLAQARFLASSGDRRQAETMLCDLERIRQTEYLDAYPMALLLDALGRRERAFEELERAYNERSYSLLFLRVDPKADPLRSDPRFQVLERQIFRSKVPAASTAC